MRGKVARAFRHYAMDKYNSLSGEEKKVVSWRRIYRYMKREYKEVRK